MVILEVLRLKNLAADHNFRLVHFLKSSESESSFVVQHHLSLGLAIFQYSKFLTLIWRYKLNLTTKED